MSVGGVVLAAGRSTRMGGMKLLLPYGGRPLLSSALDAMANSGASPAFCVLGFHADEVRNALRSSSVPERTRFLVNREYASGRASSVRLALDALPGDCEAAVFLPGDMPLIRASDVASLIERFDRTSAPIVAAVDETGRRAHPVLFARRLFSRLAGLEGDESGHAIIRGLWGVAEKVPIPRSRALDVDREEDYRRLLAQEPGGQAERGDHARVL